MSHTNSTTNYSLPQFVTSDKPAWLTDINNAFSAIDTGMNNAQTKANTADTNASQALLDASAASTAASAADSKGAGAVASIADTFKTTETYAVGDIVIYNNLLYICTTAVNVPGAWTGSTNWSRETVEGYVDDKNGTNIPLDSSSKAPNIKTAIAAKQDKNSAVQIATFSFQKAVAANAQTGYTCLRSDFNLPAGSKAISVFLREYSPNTVNAGGLIYSAQIDATSSTCVEGQIYNGTASTRTYYITATVFYTLA